MTDQTSPADEARRYSPAFIALQHRAAAGEHLTLADIEQALTSDPQTRDALAALAVDLRASVDLSIDQMAARTGVPKQFLIAAAGSLITGMSLAATSETLH